MITTNDKMNKTVKETLKMRGDNMSLYAVKRIEELEEQLCETCQNKGQYYAGALIGYVNCPDCNEIES